MSISNIANPFLLKLPIPKKSAPDAKDIITLLPRNTEKTSINESSDLNMLKINS